MPKSKKFNIPMILLSLISILFFGSIIYEINNKEESDVNKIVDLEKLLKKNSYEENTGHKIQVEVLNGCGQKKIALMYKKFLREEGYDVMDAKNAKSFDKLHTKIFYHTDNIKMAEHLSDLLGVNDSLIVNDSNYDLMFDLTIIIGNDFKELPSYDDVSVYFPTY